MKFNNKRILSETFWMTLKQFLVIFLPLSVLLYGIIMSIYFIESRNEKIMIQNKEIANINLLSQIITSDFELVISDLMILSDNMELKAMIESDEALHKKALAEFYLSYSRRKKLYDQIRFLDDTGKEKVRINFNKGKPSITPKDQLQFKGDRYYFQKTIQINPGKVYVSPFDLNIEQGQIEKPLKPIMRFGTVVLDRKGKKKGIVLVNYLGTKLINHFDEVSSQSSGQFMLLNPEGYWLKGQKPEDEWGFMFEDRKYRSFGNSFPNAWEMISTTEAGQFSNEDGMFTFDTIYPLSMSQKSGSDSDNIFGDGSFRINTKDYFWKILSQISLDDLNAGPRRLFGRLIQLYMVLISVIAIGSGLLAKVRIDRRKAEKKLEQTAEDLKRSNTELEQFAYVASHDLKEPLLTIAVDLKLLQRRLKGKHAPETEEFIEKAIERSNQMQELISDLLRYSRAGTHGQQFEVTDSSEVLNRTLSNLKYTIDKSGAEVTHDPLPLVMTDPVQLGELFQNLINNSIKFHSEEHPRIHISAERKGKEWVFYVRDNGIGIAREDIDKIFNIFQRLHRDECPGSGIGLATCKKIVERHGGHIWVESEPGRGSIFYFTLPAEYIYQQPKKNTNNA